MDRGTEMVVTEQMHREISFQKIKHLIPGQSQNTGKKVAVFQTMPACR